MKRALVTLAIVSAGTLGTAVWVHAQDRKVVDPTMRVLLENDRVRVQEHFLKPGEKIGMHSHPAKVIYAVNDWKVRVTFPDGSSRIGEGKAGEAKWAEAVTHAIENIGYTDVQNIVIELKEQPTAKQQ